MDLEAVKADNDVAVASNNPLFAAVWVPALVAEVEKLQGLVAEAADHLERGYSQRHWLVKELRAVLEDQ